MRTTTVLDMKVAEPSIPTENRSGVPVQPFWTYAVLAVTAVLVRIPSYLAPAELSYDDGVYRAAALAMRSGGHPFRDVWSPQGPWFYPAVWLGDLLGFRSMYAPRLIAVLAGVATTLAVAHIAGRKGPVFFWTAGMLMATSGTVLRTTGALTGDGVALAWSLLALAAATAFCVASHIQEDLRTNIRNKQNLHRWVIGIGVLLGFAVGTKNLLVLPTTLLVAWMLWKHAGFRSLLLAASTSAAVVIGGMFLWGLRPTYQQSIQYHLEKSAHQSLGDRWHKLTTVLLRRDVPILVFLGLAVLLGVYSLIRARARQAKPRSFITPLLPYACWTFGTVVLLLSETAMFANHISFLIAPMLLFSVSLFAMPQQQGGQRFNASPRWIPTVGVAAAIGLIGIGSLLWGSNEFLNPPERSNDQQRIQAAVRSLPSNAKGLSDEPGVLAFENVEIPGYFVDGSQMRLESNVTGIQVSADLILKEAQQPNQCLLVIWQPNIWGSIDELPDELTAIGYERTDLSRNRSLWIRKTPECQSS